MLWFTGKVMGYELWGVRNAYAVYAYIYIIHIYIYTLTYIYIYIQQLAPPPPPVRPPMNYIWVMRV